jgi:hypothetical protein
VKLARIHECVTRGCERRGSSASGPARAVNALSFWFSSTRCARRACSFPWFLVVLITAVRHLGDVLWSSSFDRGFLANGLDEERTRIPETAGTSQRRRRRRRAAFARGFYDAPKLFTAEEWVSVLHLSHKWNFTSLQAVAVRELDLLTTAVDKIVLSQQYGIEPWLERAYVDIYTAEDWLSDADGLRLGVSAVLKIGRARHELRMPAALQPENLRIKIVRAAFGFADPIGTPTTALGSCFASEVALTNALLDNAAKLASSPASEPDAESAKVCAHAGQARASSFCGSLTVSQAALKSFIETTVGWTGSGASERWSCYARYANTTEKEALRQVVDEAHLFVTRAQSESPSAREVASQSATLLEAVTATFEPIKARYELWTLSVDAMQRFDEWLDTCLDLVRRDPWISSANKSRLESSLVEANQTFAWLLQQHNYYADATVQPRTTASQVDDRRCLLEAEITAILGSCPSMRPSSIGLHQ